MTRTRFGVRFETLILYKKKNNVRSTAITEPSAPSTKILTLTRTRFFGTQAKFAL